MTEILIYFTLSLTPEILSSISYAMVKFASEVPVIIPKFLISIIPQFEFDFFILFLILCLTLFFPYFIP